MIIANPIYDVVFKRLMENDRVAKFFIGTLLNETIEEVQVKPQEFTYTDKLAGIAVFRVDFIATIKSATGEFKKVLIEIQKAKNPIDLMRFRNYLAEQYKKEDEIKTLDGKKKVPLPIVTIYLFGFLLADIKSAAVHVQRQYIDLIDGNVIAQKDDFIEKLTHDCFVVQLLRIGTKYQTRLDKLLSIFEQTNFVDDKKIIKKYTHEIDEVEVKEITDILHYIGTDPDEKKQIEDEQEAYRVFDVALGGIKEDLFKKQLALDKKEKELGEKEKELGEKDKELGEKDKELGEKDKELGEKDKELGEKDKELGEKDKELGEKDKIIEDLKRKLGLN